MKLPSLLVLAAVLVASAAAQPSPSVPFTRGVNLTGWFQAPAVRQLPAGKFGPADFAQLKTLGVDGVRLPVNFAAYLGPWPGYRLDPLLLALLDQAVDSLLAEGIAVVLDNHSSWDDPKFLLDREGALRALWGQLARHYRDRPPTLLYEIQNEPHDIADADWSRMQLRILETIRRQDPRTVVVTGADWGSLKGLTALPVYADRNLVYTFHEYDPFLFTHQGAEWVDLEDLGGVTFPPRGQAPVLGGTLNKGWVAGNLKAYYAEDPVPALAAALDLAAAFGKERGVPVWCGEFGVYNRRADPADRVAWYRVVRRLLEDRDLPWTMWDYKDTFGLFHKGSAEVFEQDLNLPLVEALGFQVPPQLPPGPQKVTAGFSLYGEGAGPGLLLGAWAPGAEVDFYDGRLPAAGKYSLKLSGLGRYGSVSWTFAPLRDLSALVSGSRITFLARSSAARFQFDVRFVDGAAPGTGGLPWRNRVTVDQTVFPGDGAWHRVEIPLAQFREGGAWDGAWHDPEPGSFDWTRVAGLQIVAEETDLRGVTLGIDEVALR